MFVSEIKLINFRNYNKGCFRFINGVNLIIGLNGSGKTNILESIFLSSATVSQRTNTISDMLNKGCDIFHIKHNVESKNGNFVIDIEYNNTKSMKVFLNGNSIKKSELIEKFPVVLFSPEDIDIINNDPTKIRKLINIFISQISNGYSTKLINYKKINMERNNILRRINQGSITNSENKILKILTKKMFKVAGTIIDEKIVYIKKLNDEMRNVSNEMKINDDIRIKYHANRFRGKLSIKRDKMLGYTSWGPHRDVFSVEKNKKAMKHYCSRGEIRLSTFLIRFAQMKILKQLSNEDPVILLDDIFSELDEKNRAVIRSLFGKNQVIITSTEIPDLLDTAENVINL